MSSHAVSFDGGRHFRFAGVATAVLLAGTLVVLASVSLPVASAAPVVAEEPAGSACVEEAVDRPAAAALAAACGARVEVVSERTEWETLWAEPDGVSFTWEMSAGAVRSRVNGAWADISTKIVEGEDGFVPVSPALRMTFSSGGAGEPLARIVRDGHELVVDWPFPAPAPAPEVDGSTLTYRDVLPGVDLVVAVNEDGTGFSQVLRVASPEAAAHPALAKLTFPLRTSDGLGVEQHGGGFVAVDDAGERVFASPEPLMWDSAGEVAPGGGVRALGGPASPSDRVVRPLEGDRVAVMPTQVRADAVTITPDRQMLTDRHTAWPVFIDPTISGGPSEWTMIQSCCTTTETYKFAADQGTGRCQTAYVSSCNYNSTKRIIWEYAFPSVARGKKITSATFKAYQTFAYDCDTGWVRAYKTALISSSTNWSNFHSQMDGSNSLDSEDSTRKQGCPTGPGYTTWNVKAGVQSSADASATRIALGVRSANESSMPSSWKRFDGDSAVLSITYNTKPGTPALTAPSAGSIITDTTPTLKAKSTDADGNNVRMHYEIRTPGGSLVKSGSTGYVSSGATASWTSGTLSQGNYKFRARAYDSLEYGSWSGYRNFSLDRSGPTTSTRKTNGSTACGIKSTDTTPTLSIKLSDNYGGNIEADFEMRNKTTGAYVVDTNTSLAAKSSGSIFIHTTPVLGEGSYEWRVRGRDARNLWGSYTGWCGYSLDTTPPDAPTVELQADPYELGQDGTFTATGDPDTAAYLWGLNTDAPTTQVTTTGGAAKQITIPGAQLAKFGPNWITVRSVDDHGLESDDTTRLVFDVEGFGESGRWRLDGNGQDIDCSGATCVPRTGGHDLAFEGGYDWVDGKWALTGEVDPFTGEPIILDPTDRALYADGATGYGTTSGAGPVATTSNFSVAAWVQMDPAASFPAAVSQIGDTAAAFYLGYAEDAWAFTMKSVDGSGGTVRALSATVTPDPDPDQWVHLLGVYDNANSQIRLYVNGELAGEATFTAQWQAGGPLLVGRAQAGGNPADFWPGTIDEVRAFPGALSDQDIVRIYEEERADPPPFIETNTPTDDSTDIPLDTAITATFSEPIDPDSVTVKLATPAGESVLGVQDYDPVTNTVTFTSNAELESVTEYSVTVSGAHDLDGISMGEPVTWWFNTLQGDTTPPSVGEVTPAPGATEVLVTSQIVATLSEPVDEATIGFELIDGAEHPVDGSTSYDPGTRTVTFTPDAELDPWTAYTATITGAVDQAGNPMVPESWSFTTESGDCVDDLESCLVSYEAEAGVNTLGGEASLRSVPAASGGAVVSSIGNTAENFLQFNDVVADAAGDVGLRISYVTDEPRQAEMSVNGGTPVVIDFPSSGNLQSVNVLAATVNLEEGNNTIRFANPDAWAPNVDRIVVGPVVWLGPPVAEYSFDELAGTSALDTSGNGHDLAAASGAESWSTNAKHGVGAANGGSFKGMIAESRPLPELTIMSWVYVGGGAGNYRAILGYSPDGSSGLYFNVTPNDVLDIYANGKFAESAATVPNGEWAHVAVVLHDTGTVAFYVNGQNVGLGFSSGANPYIDLGAGEYEVGSENGGSSPFAGQIDDLRVFDAALTSAEIEYWMTTPGG